MKFESKKDILFNSIVLGLNAILVGIAISIILNGKMGLYKYGISILIIGADDKKWELWECLFAVILLSIFIEPYNREEKLLKTPK